MFVFVSFHNLVNESDRWTAKPYSMIDDNLNQPPPDGPIPEEEPWLSKDEIMKLFDVTDRQLVHWRTHNKIIFKTVKNRTFYKASSVQAQMKKTKRPKKYWRFKSLRKSRTIDPPLGILIVAVIFLLPAGFKHTNNWIAWMFYNWASIFLTFIALGIYLFRLLLYTYKRLFEKKEIE